MTIYLIATIWVLFFYAVFVFIGDNRIRKEFDQQYPLIGLVSKTHPGAYLFPGLLINIDLLSKMWHGASIEEKTKNMILCNAPEYHLDPAFFRSLIYLETLLFGVFAGIALAFVLESAMVFPISGLLVGGVYFYLRWLLFEDLFKSRARSIKRQLPYAVEIMGMVLEAGGNVNTGMESLIKELKGNPIAEEFAIILRESQSGKPRVEAFRDFQRKYDDPDIVEFVFALTKGEEMGTPLAKILYEQSHVMRLKLSQWSEKSAAEANMKILFPSLLIMLASLICITGPIFLPLIFNPGQE